MTRRKQADQLVARYTSGPRAGQTIHVSAAAAEKMGAAVEVVGPLAQAARAEQRAQKVALGLPGERNGVGEG